MRARLWISRIGKPWPMNASAILVIAWMLLGDLGTLSSLIGSELGDVDGDGRLSIADDAHLKALREPVAGSLDGLVTQPCLRSLEEDRDLIRGMIYLESLRRNVPDALPHWDLPGLDAPAQKPLPPDGRVRVHLEDVSVPGGNQDVVELPLVVDTDAPISSFSLILESEGNVLRYWPAAQVIAGDYAWRRIDLVSGDAGTEQDSVATSPVTYLITRGRIVVTYGMGDVPRAPLMPGEHLFMVPARLPLGLAARLYHVNLLPGSEVLLEDGSLIAPSVMVPALLDVQSEVTQGWNEAVPPLEFEPGTRRVKGKIEFRIVDKNGDPMSPVAAVHPGDWFTLGVQMRTEAPLNQVFFDVTWPANEFCEARQKNDIFTSPEDGRPYAVFPILTGASTTLYGGYAVGRALFGAGYSSYTYRGRQLEHFKPLGEWVDVGQLDLKVPDGAEGGRDVPLRFLRYGRDMGGYVAPFAYPAFAPYERDWWCSSAQEDLPKDVPWEYEVSYADSFVRILEGNGGPPVRDLLDVEILLGDVSASPGQLVRVPVRGTSKEDSLIRLLLVLEFDPRVVAVEGLEVPFIDPRNGAVETRVVLPDPREAKSVEDCPPDFNGDGAPDGRCTIFAPSGVWLRDLSIPDRLYIHFFTLTPSDPTFRWLNTEERVLFQILARVRQDATVSETSIKAATVTYPEGPQEVTAKSAGVLLEPHEEGCQLWTRLRSPIAGRILLGPSFVRGDANADGKVDITDAIKTLNYLFVTGQKPGCAKAADANNTGELNISDAVFTLSVLFLGKGQFSPPFPECGADPGSNNLSCDAPCPAQ